MLFPLLIACGKDTTNAKDPSTDDKYAYDDQTRETAADSIPDDYDLVARKDDDNYKYIATAVEALLGAHYMEYRDYDAVLRIVSRFKELIDQNG